MPNSISSRCRSHRQALAVAASTLALANGAHAQQPIQLFTPADSEAIAACDDLNAIQIPELARVESRWVPAGPSTLIEAELDAHCRVSGRIDPVINFELWLPADWNGRFVAVGSDELAGSIDYDSLAAQLNRGYATVTTDGGHRDGNLNWLGNTGLLRDFAYRATYEVTAKSQVLVNEFYGSSAQYRYYIGCAEGGRQGLMEAQRFPGDYDGIVAVSPSNHFVDARVLDVWAAQSSLAAFGGTSLLDASDLALASDAAVAQCDTLDGVADGVIEDPRRCGFDPARLQCGAARAGNCLTAPQVDALRSLYRGPSLIDGTMTPGYAIGGESGWTSVARAEPATATIEIFRRAVLADPFWDWRSFDLAEDYALARDTLSWMLDATSTDLTSYRDGGGKLLLFHGWNDATNSPEATVDYYEAVESAMAVEPNPQSIATRDFARLFMVPQMAHCEGGAGTAVFDAQRAIEDWVERGIGPDRIEAEFVEDGQLIRTRPLCPYPQTARYRGSGNEDRSGSFLCAN